MNRFINGAVQVPRTLFASMTCAACKQPILGPQLTALGQIYHPQCFVCVACHQPFPAGSFCPKGDPPEPYHQSCAEQLFCDRCCLCDSILRGQYLIHPFFKEEKYCLEHRQTSKICFSCQRREPTPGKTQREGFVALPDGRMSCCDCISQAIFDSEGARPLYLEAVDFIEQVLQLPIPAGMRDVPVLAVDLSSLNEQQRNAAFSSHRGSAGTSSSRSGSRGGMDNINGVGTDLGPNIVRGLTLSEVSSVRHVTPGLVTFHPMYGIQAVGGYGPIVTVEQHRDVTAVLVLYGLPRDLTASILAHEAFHVWCKLTKSMPHPLSADAAVEEGLCQYVSMRYLENLHGAESTHHGPSPRSAGAGLETLPYCVEVGSAASAQLTRTLRALFRSQIELDESPVYGEGYRRAAPCCSVLGLDIVLEHVRDTKTLPTV